ncbi:nostrin isoform X2 [Hippopotamus amphibius kiboko]|uniref:nostrin isoform X2 n=1 Tax=Hippopotamus amphibius kiboko TaxID=575201 RepID=UPI0025933D53|nr:nostrin isoform X2 [Hippopotamus amphibius kiboko]
MRDPLTDCSYNKVYKNLKAFSQNGEDFCKQITSILQQRANLEINYAKGLQKLATKLSKTLQSTKKNCLVSAWAWVSEGMKSAADLHQKLGKAIELEAIKPAHHVLSAHEKKRKSLDNEVEKTTNLVISNWNQQIKAKKKLMVSTKKHEALFHLVESSKQITTEKEKQKINGSLHLIYKTNRILDRSYIRADGQLNGWRVNWNKKLLNKLKKSTEKLSKEDENYYQKNIASCSTRLKWENTLENFFQSILELEKERIQLLCNNLNQYSQHISVFGQTLTTCHTQIHCAVSKIDVENDIQALMEETAVSSTENKSEFLLTDYFEEDPKNAMSKERQVSSIKSKLSRLKKDIEKASRDQEGLERMLKAYSSHSSFSDTESRKSTAALMDENNLKLDLLQANAYKLSSVLAELEQRPQANHACSNSIFKWKEKQTHSSVKISRPFLTKRLEDVVSRASSGGQRIPSSPSTASGVTQFGNGLCKALYSFQARQDDELNLEKGDIVTIHKKKDEGWWFGSLKGKQGHFPAAYVEELPSNAGDTSS